MAKDAVSRKPKGYARNEGSKETENRDYHMYDSAGKSTSRSGQAKSCCYQHWLEPKALLKLEPINTCLRKSKEGSPNHVKEGRETDQKGVVSQEIREAEAEVVRSCQRDAFSNEYKALVSRKPIRRRVC